MDIELLDHEFEIDEDAKYLSREIRRKITEKIEAYCNILHGILQPEASSVHQVYESSYFEDKDEVMKLYKELMKYYRESQKLGILLDEEKEKEFINRVFGEWKSIKETMSSIMQRLMDSWSENSEIEEDLRYLG